MHIFTPDPWVSALTSQTDFYSSTITPFYQIRETERTKYATALYRKTKKKIRKESSATNCHLKEKNFALDFGAATYLSFMESIVKVYHEKIINKYRKRR